MPAIWESGHNFGFAGHMLMWISASFRATVAKPCALVNVRTRLRALQLGFIDPAFFLVQMLKRALRALVFNPDLASKFGLVLKAECIFLMIALD